LLLVFVTACDKNLLDVTDENRLSQDVFWQNADEANRAIIGAYSPLAIQLYWGRMMILFTVYRSDAVNPVNNKGVITDATNFDTPPSFPRLAEIWGEIWKPIFRANNILENVPQIEDPNFSAEQRNNILGEARFLRALQNFYLITMFRNVPLITKPAESLDEIRQAPAAPEEVWQQIITDLKEAQNLLPQSWGDANMGRATSGAATALLGKTYLYRSGIEGVNEYGAAATEFKKIIDAGNYALMANHADNFGNDKENNQESLFEIQHDDVTIGWTGGDTPNDLRAAAWEPDLAPPGFTSQAGMLVNSWVKDAFLAEKTVDGAIDPRAFSTLLWNEEGVMIYEKTFQEGFAANLDLLGIRKYLDFRSGKAQSDFGFGGQASTINWRLIRYSDVLLMYAEAENEANGGSAAALAALNEVRQRANMPVRTTTDQNTLRQQIRDERVLELIFEGDRYLDLLRWGLVPTAITDELKSNTGGSKYQAGREYLPIPSIEINTNKLYPQNPGY
jgi:hypothetical protein